MPRKLRLEELRPAGVVIEVAGDERDVDVAGLANRFAVVEALEDGEQPRVLLDGPRQRVEMPRARVAGEGGPAGERRQGGRDRA